MNDSTFPFDKAKSIFKTIEGNLISEHFGEVVAVEPDSGDYVVGKNEIEVAEESKKRHPGKLFGFFRIGHKSLYQYNRI